MIKDKLVSASVLSYPMGDEGYFVLDTIDFAMGGVLSQMQQGDEKSNNIAVLLNCYRVCTLWNNLDNICMEDTLSSELITLP